MMAYEYQTDEEKQQGQQGQPVVAAQGATVTQGASGQGVTTTQTNQNQDEQTQVQLTGQSGDIQGATPASPEAVQQTQAAPEAGGSGQFTDITSYLEQNNPQSIKLATNVGQHITTQGQEARDAVGQVQKDFGTQVQENTVEYNEGLANQAANNPTSVTASPELTTEFQGMAQADYQGPMGIDDMDDWFGASQQVEKAVQTGDLIDTDEGRMQLLQQIQQGRRRGNAGVLALNNLLLTGQDAREILENSREEISDLRGLVSQVTEQSSAIAQEAKRITDETKQKIEEKFLGDAGVVTTFQGQLDQQTEKAKQEAKAKAEAIIASISAGQPLTTQQLQQLGLTPNEYKALLDSLKALKDEFGVSVNMRSYTTQGSTDKINRNNVATPEQKARMDALAELLGFENTTLTGQVGGANTNLVNFDYKRALQDLQRNLGTRREERDRKEAEIPLPPVAPPPSSKSSPSLTQSIIDDTVKVIEAAIPGITVLTTPVKRWFCFAENTPILMEDYTYKSVQNLKIGDITAHGGMVLSTGQALSQEVYEYEGVRVTGRHVVFEDNQYVRVENSKKAKLITLSQPIMVYPISNERHILIPNNDVVFADYIEYDAPGASDDELLELLNTHNISKAQLVEQQLELSRSWRKQNNNLKIVRG